MQDVTKVTLEPGGRMKYFNLNEFRIERKFILALIDRSKFNRWSLVQVCHYDVSKKTYIPSVAFGDDVVAVMFAPSVLLNTVVTPLKATTRQTNAKTWRFIRIFNTKSSRQLLV